MASRFWVGGAGTWDNSTTTQWSSSSGGGGGSSVPTTTDDVFFDGSSGAGTVTLNYSASINSVDYSNFTGTFTSTGSITFTCANSYISGTTATFTNNGSQSLAFGLGSATSDITLKSTNQFGSGGISFVAGAEFRNVSITMGVASGNYSVALSGGLTIDGILTIDGSGSSNNGLRFRSNTTGTQRTITLGASSSVSLSRVIFQDITVTGTGVPISGTRLGIINNCSGITTSPTTYYWIGHTGNYNDTTKWSLSSGGASAGQYPTINDICIFDTNSFSAAGQVFTINVIFIATLDFSNSTNDPTLTMNTSSGTGTNMVGNLILKSGMTWNGTTGTLTVNGAGNTILSQNSVIPSGSLANINLTDVGNTLSLGSDLSITGTFTVTFGTFDRAGFNTSMAIFSSSNSNIRSIFMRSGDNTLTGTGTVWTTATITGLTFDGGSSTTILNNASSSSKTFSSGNLTFYNLQLTGAGTGTFNIVTTTSITFNSLIVDTPPHTVLVSAGKTINLTGINPLIVSGSPGNLNTFASSVNGTSWFITANNAISINENYISLRDSHASGSTTFYAGNDSTNVSNNTGWNFTSLNSRLSKVIAWQNKVPFPIKYCIQCRKLIPVNHRDYNYCDTCDKSVKIVTSAKKEDVKTYVSKKLDTLKTIPKPKKVVSSPQAEIPAPKSMYVKIEPKL